ncbi:methylcrotonoyl-CoA carboxylase [Sphingorhabdus lutea]|uniref:Methylcrotonoyl-CoA carboxylase n=1 Tax=Sphingorhabdus lutea TaxID=1913578 RepID=A0A1L3J9X8_9SPHN|nr:acetyl/propionyl/methylcrotonyl-CoA carboxylase subunit alpha [Sphingorhabdus lutea]APG61931.1 methylcrotonoyl-CoA carboxylase [Sphingorhabdus lutea]
MITSLLIANRGEIACRIIRTARKMGIRTIAVYSDADARALHVRMADEAVHIGPSAVAESYLVGDKIIAAAKQTGAQAIHPGYGFLSENAEFAQSVIDEGLIWVGPNPASITAMGLKDAAKKLMDDAGVPTTPGYMGDNQDAEFLAARADEIGYPVLIKAVAGGGGKGMRKVEKASDFADALLSCRREAKASFGNDIVLIEKWIESPRHIEVQVFGDKHGNIVHLFERDCSLQRRHQKVIEEAPAPGMDEETRQKLCAAAVKAAKAVDYVGAGTIEFIADGSSGLNADKIWFMEMNTRLQVEHPVTEEITGVDLVEWQLRVASGEPLPLRQEDLAIDGHAIEVRLYAEDPVKGFLPSVGRLEQYYLPEDMVRVDSGVEENSLISPHYDPMISKLIAHADNRTDAIYKMLDAIEGTAVWPVKSNSAFLYLAMDSEEFKAGDVTTSFIADRGDALIPASTPDTEILGQAARALADNYADQSHHSRDNELIEGFRLNAPSNSKINLMCDGAHYQLDKISDFGGSIYTSLISPSLALVTKNGNSFAIGLPRFNAGQAAGGDGAIISPMPGKIISVDVAEGQSVVKGQKLLTLEAMKMEHGMTAPFDGVVETLNAQIGGQVQVDALLVKITAKDAA